LVDSVAAQGGLDYHPGPAERGEVVREMALVEEAKGDLTQAASHMNESVDLATEVSEPGALARSLLALGTLEACRGNAERGLEFKTESLRVAERGGNLTETARARIGVGVALHALGRPAEQLAQDDGSRQLA